MSDISREVRSCKVLSLASNCKTRSRAWSVGTEVKRLITSKDTKMSLGPTHWLRIKFANSLEFFTLYEFFKRGETIKRAPKNHFSRLKEHQRAIKQQKPENSALCEHVILFDHVIDWANSQILKTESNFSKRLTAESWFILSRPKVINRSDDESIAIVNRSLL